MIRFASNRLGTSAVSFVLPTLLALASAGCDDALTRVDLVANLRVLAARVEVDGEPDRASPLPGEAAAVRWLVADRHPEPPLGWTFAACEAAPPGSSLPSCAAEPFATASADVPVAGEPRIDFVVPDETTAGALALFGVVCPDSAPVGDGDSLDCAGPGGRLVSLDFVLGSAALVNTNPTIDPEAFEAAVALKEPVARWAGEQRSMYHIWPPQCQIQLRRRKRRNNRDFASVFVGLPTGKRGSDLA